MMTHRREPYLVIDDEAQAFLKAPLADIRRLGLADGFGSTSYMDQHFAYLDMENENALDESKSDGEVFLQALFNKGETVEIENRHDPDVIAFINTLGPYKGYFVDHPLKPGDIVSLGAGQKAEITGIGEEQGAPMVQVQTMDLDPAYFSFPLSHASLYITAPKAENEYRLETPSTPHL